MTTIAHLSDLHYSEKNLAEADRCTGFAVDAAIRAQVDVAVVTGDATDHALDMHNPAVRALMHQIRRLADHCPVLMLQGTFSHEPPGALGVFPLLGGRFPVYVADRIGQVALTRDHQWIASAGWRFDAVPADASTLFTCVPTVNKAIVAGIVGAEHAAAAVGTELAALLAGYGPSNRAARVAGLATVVLGHGTVTGSVTEHGVPMAGLDHEFTVPGLLSAGAAAVMLGHIHLHQVWDAPGQLVAYAGSIGRNHYGERGDKGLLLWDVQAAGSRFELVVTPAKRTVDLEFDGVPDMQAIAAAAQDLGGAHVRVRWTVAEEDRDTVDRAAIERALAGAAHVQLEGRIVPVTRSRAQGISQAGTLAEKVRMWATVTGCDAAPLVSRLEVLANSEPTDIAQRIVAGLADKDQLGGPCGDGVHPVESKTLARVAQDLFEDTKAA